MAKKTKIVHVAVEPDKYRQLKNLSASWACPVSQIIRSAIHNLLVDEAKATQAKEQVSA